MGSPPEGVILLGWLGVSLTPPDIVIKSISISQLHKIWLSNFTLSWWFCINIVSRLIHWFSMIEPPILLLIISDLLLLHDGSSLMMLWPPFSMVRRNLNIITKISFNSDHSEGHDNLIIHVLYILIIPM